MDIPKKHLIWKNGKHLDLWTINHILSGALFGYVTFLFDMDMIFGLVLSLFLMIAWEFFERIILKVVETWQNGVWDVVVGFIFFILIWIIAPYQSLGTQTTIYLLLFVIFIIMELAGLISYKYLHGSKNSL